MMSIFVKYIISGSTAAIIDLTVLNFLDGIGLYYLISINIAFIVAFLVSFSLQKYWTFNDSENGKIHYQIIIYFIISIVNIVINSTIIHFLFVWNIVSGFFIFRPVVVAQIISGIIVAAESFFIYRFFIFKKDYINNKRKVKDGLKILIITQKLDKDDSYFGFFHDWIIKFSERCEKVTVISLETYSYDLPGNVEVFSLTKEKGRSRIRSLYLLLKYSIKEKQEYDFVFCHMSPVYVISGYLVWKYFNKKIALWYVHRSADLKLRIANWLSDIVFTATKESLNLRSTKVKYLGQAVPVERFSRPLNNLNINKDLLKILTVGRITKIKNLGILVDAISEVKSKGINIRLNIIGLPISDLDRDYEKYLKDKIKKANLESNITFLGPVANKDIKEHYWNNDICINLSPTGGLDKTVLEAMAAGTLVISSNKAFKDHFNGFYKELLCNENDYIDCANKIIALYNMDDTGDIRKALFEEVKKRSSLDNLVLSIVNNINELV